MQTCDDVLDLGNSLVLRLCEQLDVLFLSGNELVERGIQEADGYRQTLHSLIELLKVALLHGQQLIESGFSLLNGVGADHLADGSDSVIVEEHVLGTAQTDALCAELK